MWLPHEIPLIWIVDYDPGLNLASSESRPALPEWLTEQRDGVRICRGTERCSCRACSLIIGRGGEQRCGSAGIRGRWLLSAVAAMLRAAFRGPIWTTAKTFQVPARDNREDDGEGDGLPGHYRNIFLTAGDVSIVNKQWYSCECVKVAAAKIRAMLPFVRCKHRRRHAVHPEHVKLLTGELVVSNGNSQQQQKNGLQGKCELQQMCVTGAAGQEGLGFKPFPYSGSNADGSIIKEQLLFLCSAFYSDRSKTRKADLRRAGEVEGRPRLRRSMTGGFRCQHGFIAAWSKSVLSVFRVTNRPWPMLRSRREI